jgi:two-component system cell cycle sensor histidine kinase/response regulator CckA
MQEWHRTRPTYTRLATHTCTRPLLRASAQTTSACLGTVAARALTRAGYEVTPCANGEEGLAAITEGAVQFDIVVSDVVMPGMDGPAMVRAIRAKLPNLPVLFMSGYAEEQLRRDIDIPDMHFIAKPFSVASIGDKVGAVLREARVLEGSGLSSGQES